MAEDQQDQEQHKAAKDHDWSEDYKTIFKSSEELKDAETWLKDQSFEKADSNYDEIDVNVLNSKQKLCFDLVLDWTKKKLDDKADTKPFYLNVSGPAGTGKGFIW